MQTAVPGFGAPVPDTCPLPGATLSPRRRARLGLWRLMHNEPHLPWVFGPVAPDPQTGSTIPSPQQVKERLRDLEPFSVQDDTMAPRFAYGDVLACQEITTPDLAALLPGAVYVGVLPEGDVFFGRLDGRALAAALRRGRGRLLFTLDREPGRWLWVKLTTPGLRLYRVVYYIAHS